METTMTPCSSRKRKACVDDDAGSKRLKPDSESGQTTENGRLPRSPRITVSPEHIPRAVAEEELLELLHYSAVDKARGRVCRPSWCRLHKQRLVRAVTVAVVDHVSQSDFYEHFLSMPNLRNKYSTRVTLAASSTNLLSEIFRSRVSITHTPPAPSRPEKRDAPQLHKVLRNHPVLRKFGTECRGLTAYLLSAEEMSRKNFPFTGRPGCEDYVRTNSDAMVTDSSPLFGLDCEMCITDEGSELTRVSLVDSTGTCVLDQLVKPHNKIRNYLTQFSGVTRQLLKPVKTTLSEVQAKVMSLLPQDAVLVGHSLENDLRALKMIHPHVIDTSLLYRRELGHRFKLKVLTETLLRRQIQTEDRRGHDPSEDAAAALELAQYFITNGPLKVVQEHLEELWGYSLTEEVEETSRQVPTEPTRARFRDVLQDSGRTVAFFGRRSDIGLHISKQQWFSSDREVLQSFRDQPKCPSFSVLQFCPGPTDGTHAALRTQVRPLCVVFAGPLPPHSSEEDVRRLFCCCGPLRSVRIIHTAVRVHAEVQFQLPESAVLALSALNGFTLREHCLTVQRPVDESTLDVEVTVGALQADPLTSRLLYVVSLSPDIAEFLRASAHTAETSAEAGSPGPVHVNGLKTQRPLGLSEDLLLDTFSRFGPVVQIVTRATHAYVGSGSEVAETGPAPGETVPEPSRLNVISSHSQRRPQRSRSLFSGSEAHILTGGMFESFLIKSMQAYSRTVFYL
uniref:RNA exonuclease 5 n=1 Tax=Neogobius melanostomus TaxID=47308 RepID=A0A8C6TB75_9GOBI